MNKLDEFVGACPTANDGFQHGLVAFAPGGGHIITQPKPTPLQGGVKLVAVVGHVLIKIHNTTVELAHILHDGTGYETSFDKILQDTFRYPLGILDIALAAGQLLDEIRILLVSDKTLESPTRVIHGVYSHGLLSLDCTPSSLCEKFQLRRFFRCGFEYGLPVSFRMVEQAVEIHIVH